MTEAHAQFFAEFDALCGACQPVAAVPVTPQHTSAHDPQHVAWAEAFHAWSYRHAFGPLTVSHTARRERPGAPR